MILLLGCIITTAVVCVWVTAVVNTAIKNQLMQRQGRQLRYWQRRAMRAEDPSWRHL